jgi:DNA-binding NtrC family response regulator
MQRVLIVDDHAPIRRALTDYFERGGFSVASTGDLLEAIRHIQSCDFVAAIIDLRLSGPRGREGFELLELSSRICPGTRTVMLTSCAGPREEEEARRLGAAAFLTKPLPLADVMRAAIG